MPPKRDDTRVDFSAKSMVQDYSIPSPGNKTGWSDRPVAVGEGGRAGWSAEVLEQMISDKIQQKIGSGNGQQFEALRIFCGDDSDCVTPDIFKQRVSELLNTTLSDEEVQSVFDKYDEDGGGSISLSEICSGIFGLDFAQRSCKDLEGKLKWEEPEGYEAPPSPVLPGYGGHVPGSVHHFGGYSGRAVQRPVSPGGGLSPRSPRSPRSGGEGSPSNGVGAYPGHDAPLIHQTEYTSYITSNNPNSPRLTEDVLAP